MDSKILQMPKQHNRKCIVLVACVMCLSASIYAQGPEAHLGDLAAPLDVAEWIKGEPVDIAKGKGKEIYVIDFWASWAVTCKKSTLELSKIQDKYRDKGVVVIGVANETADVIKAWGEEMESKITYRLAMDNRRKTTNAYLQAFRVLRRLPHSFVIDKEGRIVWHGHPMDGLDKVLGELVSGTFSLETAKTEAEARATNRAEMMHKGRNAAQLATQYFQKARAGQNEEARVIGDKFLDELKDVPPFLNMFAMRILLAPDMKDRDVKLALKLTEAANKATNECDPRCLSVYAKVLTANGMDKEAAEIQKKILSLTDKPMLKEGGEDTVEKMKPQSPPEAVKARTPEKAPEEKK